MSEALRARLHQAADSAAQAFEDALAAYLAERLAGDRLMPLDEAGAKFCGWSASTVRRKHREGKLPFPLVVVDGVRYARQSDVEVAIREAERARRVSALVEAGCAQKRRIA